MSKIYPYLKPLVYSKILASYPFPDAFGELETIEVCVLNQIEAVLTDFKIETEQEFHELAVDIVDELIDSSCIQKIEDEVAGRFYKVNKIKANQTAGNFRNSSEIEKTAKIVGNTFYKKALTNYFSEPNLEKENLKSAVMNGNEISESLMDEIDSTDWTGVSQRIDAARLEQIKSQTNALLQTIQQSDCDDRTKVNAEKRIRAIVELVEAPDPPWKVIAELLSSPILTAFLNTATLLSIILGS